MLSMAICDDDRSELTTTASLISSYQRDRPKSNLFMTAYQSASELMEQIELGKTFHIYLLDILMPDINGIALGEVLRKNNKHAKIIYLTNSPDYAVQSYQVRAYHYIIKPLVKSELYKILDLICGEYLKWQERFILVHTRLRMYSVSFEEIQYIENIARSHTVRYCLEDNECLESVAIQQPFHRIAEPFLSDSRFLKIGSSFLINMCYIKYMEKTSLTMKDSKEISIPQAFRSKVRSDYFNFVLNRENWEW